MIWYHTLHTIIADQAAAARRHVGCILRLHIYQYRPVEHTGDVLGSTAVQQHARLAVGLVQVGHPHPTQSSVFDTTLRSIERLLHTHNALPFAATPLQTLMGHVRAAADSWQLSQHWRHQGTPAC